MPESARALLLLGLLCGPLLSAPAPTQDDDLARHCRESAALVSVAVAVDEHSGGLRADLLVDVAGSAVFGEPRGRAPAQALVAFLTQAERLDERLDGLDAASLEALGAERVTAARLGFATHCVDLCDRGDGARDADLDALYVGWTARFVALSCDAGSVSAATAEDLAGRLGSASERLALLDDPGGLGERLNAAAAKLRGQEQTGSMPSLDMFKVSIEEQQAALAALANELRGLAAAPDAAQLAHSLERARGEHLRVGDEPELQAAWNEMLAGLVDVELQPTAPELFAGAFSQREALWRGVGDERVAQPLASDLERARVAVLDTSGRLHALPSPWQLGRARPTLLPGLRYLLTLDCEAGEVRLLMELPPDLRGALQLPIPSRVPLDTLLALRADALDELIYVRQRPWSLGDWIDYLLAETGQTLNVTDAVNLFGVFLSQAGGSDTAGINDPTGRAAARAGLASDQLARRAELAQEHLTHLRFVLESEPQRLERLRLPTRAQAEWAVSVLGPLLEWNLGGLALLTEDDLRGSGADGIGRVTVDIAAFDVRR